MTTEKTYLSGREVLSVIDTSTPRGKAVELYVLAREEQDRNNKPLFDMDGLPMSREDRAAISAIRECLIGKQLPFVETPGESRELEAYDRIGDLVKMLRIVTDRLSFFNRLYATETASKMVIEAARDVLNGTPFEEAIFDALITKDEPKPKPAA